MLATPVSKKMARRKETHLRDREGINAEATKVGVTRTREAISRRKVSSMLSNAPGIKWSISWI